MAKNRPPAGIQDKTRRLQESGARDFRGVYDEAFPIAEGIGRYEKWDMKSFTISDYNIVRLN